MGLVGVVYYICAKHIALRGIELHVRVSPPLAAFGTRHASPPALWLRQSGGERKLL